MNDTFCDIFNSYLVFNIACEKSVSLEGNFDISRGKDLSYIFIQNKQTFRIGTMYRNLGAYWFSTSYVKGKLNEMKISSVSDFESVWRSNILRYATL